jgi:radical SAM superfamily enzyme with C-terminal helix-hairpin-helix motif
MALKRLIEQDEVVAIIGASTSGSTLAGIPIIEKAAVPSISLVASIKIVGPVKKWVRIKARSGTKLKIRRTFLESMGTLITLQRITMV